MAITLEDGTGKSDAESFASVAEFDSFVSARGLSGPSTDAAKEQLLRKAAEFLNGMEDEFKGERVLVTQALCFPREGVLLFNQDLLSETEIPTILKNAQIQLAVEAYTTDLAPNGGTQETLREKVGPIETSYAQTNSTNNQPRFNKVMNFLRPLLRTGAGQMTVYRA